MLGSWLGFIYSPQSIPEPAGTKAAGPDRATPVGRAVRSSPAIWWPHRQVLQDQILPGSSGPSQQAKEDPQHEPHTNPPQAGEMVADRVLAPYRGAWSSASRTRPSLMTRHSRICARGSGPAGTPPNAPISFSCRRTTSRGARPADATRASIERGTRRGRGLALDQAAARGRSGRAGGARSSRC